MSEVRIAGTHSGRVTDTALRERRERKNARNRARRGEERAVGSSHIVTKRLYRRGNRQQRGEGR